MHIIYMQLKSHTHMPHHSHSRPSTWTLSEPLTPVSALALRTNAKVMPRSETFADPLLDGLGICACGNSLCTPSSGLNCALTGTAVYTCTSSAVDPYRRSRLMRRALY